MYDSLLSAAKITLSTLLCYTKIPKSHANDYVRFNILTYRTFKYLLYFCHT